VFRSCRGSGLGLLRRHVLGLRRPGGLVLAAVGKDLFVIVGFSLIFIVTGYIFIGPAWFGKLCTDSQMVLGVAVLLGPDFTASGGVPSDFS